MPRLAGYTQEDVQRAFQRSRSHQSLAVQLGISSSAARKVIAKSRVNLIVSSYVMPKDGGHPMPLYVWKKHVREKDREYPKVPKTWAEKCDSSYNKAVAEYRHEMLIDMLFADGVAGILKAEAEFERKVEGLARHKLPSDAKRKYNKQTVIGLKLVSGKLLNVRKPVTENHKPRVPVNQDTFWIQRAA